MITALVTLALVLGGAWSWRVARRLSPELPPFGRGALAGGLFVSLPLVTIGLAGHAAHRLDVGVIAWAAAALVLLGVSLRDRRALPPVDRIPNGRAVLLATLVIGAVYASLAVRYQMHDEFPIFGHKSMIEQLRAGAYPPYFPPLPAQDARYHYGFDVLAGVLANAYGLSSDAAIDLVMVGLVLLMSWAAAALTADAGAPRAAPLAAIAIHLGAGMSWLTLAGVAGRHPRCLIQYHHPTCGVELFPTPMLNVFQHPVSVGVPLMLVAWLCTRRLIEQKRWAPWALLSLLVMPALALGQIVYFALGALAAVAGAVVARRGWGAVRLVVVLALSGLVARALGGMLEPADVIDPGLLLRRAVIGFPSPELIPILRHHVANLGIGFLVLPAAAIYALLRRNLHLLTLCAFAFGGVLVFHLYTYTRSWDIVKFPSAAAFALTLVYVIAVDANLRGGGILVPWLRRGGRALLLGSGLLVVVWLAFPLDGDRRLYDLGNRTADPLVLRTIEWLRGHDYARPELVLAQANVASELAVYGGLSVVATDGDFYALGVRMDLIRAQESLAMRARSTLDKAALAKLGVRWLVYSDEELANLGPTARAALTSSTTPGLQVVASFEGESPGRRRRIWRVE